MFIQIFDVILTNSQLKMQALSPLADLLEKHQTRLVFVGSSTAEQLEEFVRSPTVPISGELYTDPTIALYKLFQMKSGRFRSLVMPLWQGAMRYGFGGIMEGKYRFQSLFTNILLFLI